MAVGAFPLIKLGALAVRQVAKPLANLIKSRAKNSKFFRDYICMPPAQMYHYFDVNVKMKLLGLEKPSNVKKLNEAAAIELGAELLGESIIFLVAVATLAAEYIRQSSKSAADAASIEERWFKTESRIQELEFLTEKQRTEIRELTRLIYSTQSSNRKPTPSNATTPSVIIQKSKRSVDEREPEKSTPMKEAIDETVHKLNIK